jgi:hypothetical protein
MRQCKLHTLLSRQHHGDNDTFTDLYEICIYFKYKYGKGTKFVVM